MHDEREENTVKCEVPSGLQSLALCSSFIVYIKKVKQLPTMDIYAIFLTILAGQVIVHGLLTGAAGRAFRCKTCGLSTCTYPGKNDTHGDDRDRGAARHSALC